MSEKDPKRGMEKKKSRAFFSLFCFCFFSFFFHFPFSFCHPITSLSNRPLELDLCINTLIYLFIGWTFFLFFLFYFPKPSHFILFYFIFSILLFDFLVLLFNFFSLYFYNKTNRFSIFILTSFISLKEIFFYFILFYFIFKGNN